MQRDLYELYMSQRMASALNVEQYRQSMLYHQEKRVESIRAQAIPKPLSAVVQNPRPIKKLNNLLKR